LGWRSKTIITDFTPESYTSTFNTALQLHPNYIIYCVCGTQTVIAAQVAKAHAEGIGVIAAGASGVSIGPDQGVMGEVNGSQVNTQYSTLMADVVIADATSTSGILYVWDPTAGAHIKAHSVFTQAITAAGGTVDSLSVKLTDVGAALPGQVVSYLQSHPSTKYVVFADDALIAGVPTAITNAGLKLPKIIGQAADTQQVQYVKQGLQFADIDSDSVGCTWYGVGVMAQYALGGTPTDTQPVGPFFVITKETASMVPAVLFPGEPDNFLKAWHVQ